MKEQTKNNELERTEKLEKNDKIHKAEEINDNELNINKLTKKEASIGKDVPGENEISKNDANTKGAHTKKGATVKELKKENTRKDKELSKLNLEFASMKDLLLRRQADFENYKKRTMKFQDDYKKFAIKDFALDIIMINDDLQRAIDASTDVSKNDSIEDSHNSFVKGVSLISGQIEDALKKYGIVEIDSNRQEFDPNFHEAIEIEEIRDAEFDVDTVTKVYQKGYKIEDLVLRSSKVRVAKPVEQDSNENKIVLSNNDNTENETEENNEKK